jgi:uncharacterized protein (TIGR03437 family)
VFLGQGCFASPAFVTKLNADGSQILYSTYLGGDYGEAASSLALSPDGIAYTAGSTQSRSFPTRLPAEGPLSAPSGFVSALAADGSDLVLSTYVNAIPQSVAVALDPAGNPVVAGNTSDVVISHLDYSGDLNVRPRLDAILDAASRTGTPLAPGQRISLTGAGFQANSQVCFNDVCVDPVAVADNEIVAEPPDSIPASGSIVVSVHAADGSRSNQVVMPAGAAEPALYSADNTGTGQVLALNEDGTLNSPSNPAHAGSAVTIPINGVPSSTQIPFYGGTVTVSSGTFPGLPGDVPLIHLTIPTTQSSVQVKLTLTTPRIQPGHQPVSLSVAP